MLRRELIRTLLTTGTARWLLPWFARSLPTRASEKPANAAMIYQKALGWSKGLRPDDLKRLSRAATIAIDDPWIEGLIQQASPALESLREAASIDVCRWEPMEVLFKHDLTHGQLDISNVNLVRVACLSARRLAKRGRGREALLDLFSALTLAHRVGASGVFMARVLECGGEIPAFQTLGRILPDLDRATLDDLARRLDLLPLPEPASMAIGPELRFNLSTIRAHLGTIGPRIEDDQWGEIEFDPEAAAILKRLTGGDRDKLLAHLEATGPAFDELTRLIDLPRPHCRATLDDFAKREQAIHPIAAGLVESAWGVRHMVDWMRALRSMLHAGLVLVRDGELAFRAVSDPFGPGGFTLEFQRKGQLIRSALNDAGKPEMTLQIGEAI